MRGEWNYQVSSIFTASPTFEWVDHLVEITSCSATLVAATHWRTVWLSRRCEKKLTWRREKRRKPSSEKFFKPAIDKGAQLLRPDNTAKLLWTRRRDSDKRQGQDRIWTRLDESFRKRWTAWSVMQRALGRNRSIQKQRVRNLADNAPQNKQGQQKTNNMNHDVESLESTHRKWLRALQKRERNPAGDVLQDKLSKEQKPQVNRTAKRTTTQIQDFASASQTARESLQLREQLEQQQAWAQHTIEWHLSSRKLSTNCTL